MHEGFAEPEGQDKGRSSEDGASGQAGGSGLRLAYLDGLRAVAAGYVVLFHAMPGFSAQSLTGPWRLLRRAFAFGHEAVAIFIVLSGYCLMLPVVRKRPEQHTVELGRFIRRRAFRILPPYFAALAGSLGILASVATLRTRSGTIWDDSLPGLDLGAAASHLLLVHNWSPAWAYQINGPLWSVASEWQIYFFFPLVLLPVWRRFGMLACLGVAGLLGYAPLLLARSSAMVAIPWYLLLFALGMAAAAVGFSSGATPRSLRSKVPWGMACATLWGGCFVFSMAAAHVWFAHKPLADLLVGLSTFTLLIYLTERARGAARGRLLPVLESRVLVALGHFSYSLYLTHLPVLACCFFGLRRLGWSGTALALALPIVGSCASLVIAYAFHLAVERRFIVRR